ncbi:hypothetical protein [Sphingomonas glacialis]|uniref:Uncharacterized protein n=1 Tax=Sphingomonas glacialis TaxID=658225 RepID=A0A502FF63_9SPHN|nr:hypothetical protein [Sphingomonas glacialis]TPG48060.1 hypothetical protein EAH76_21845 [Sphingomonas glacialis]
MFAPIVFEMMRHMGMAFDTERVAFSDANGATGLLFDGKITFFTRGGARMDGDEPDTEMLQALAAARAVAGNFAIGTSSGWFRPVDDPEFATALRALEQSGRVPLDDDGRIEDAFNPFTTLGNKAPNLPHFGKPFASHGPCGICTFNIEWQEYTLDGFVMLGGFILEGVETYETGHVQDMTGKMLSITITESDYMRLSNGPLQ